MNEDISKLAEKQKKQFAGHEIQGKKLGIIGLGAIGVQVANAATHLGMEVLGYDPYISVEAAWNLSRNIHHITNVCLLYTSPWRRFMPTWNPGPRWCFTIKNLSIIPNLHEFMTQFELTRV